jgi:hypothetical protein
MQSANAFVTSFAAEVKCFFVYQKKQKQSANALVCSTSNQDHARPAHNAWNDENLVLEKNMKTNSILCMI